MLEIVLATHNAGKLAELRAATAGLAVRWLSLEDFPGVGEAAETGRTFAANARRKAIEYSQRCGMIALADDSGLEVDALGGAPGVDSAFFAGQPRDDAANNRKLAGLLAAMPEERRTARYRCCMVLARGTDVLAETHGTLEGRIVLEPRGSNGFGYDPYFLIPGLGCTAAELPIERKNAISHRGQALRAMLSHVQALSSTTLRP